jgi:hypothetical protein
MPRDPYPSDPNGARLAQLFGRYPWKFIEADATERPQWKTVGERGKPYPLRPRNLWARWQDAGQLIGVRFGSTTSYGLIDIDNGSQYLNASAIADIQAALETIGIYRTVPVRSSWSGGLHLYIPLPEPVKTFDLAIALKGTLQAHGYPIAPGLLEIFPNVKAFGRHWEGLFSEYNAHRLPLQPGSGSVLLNSSLSPVGADLQRFLWAWDAAANYQDLGELKSALKIGRENHRRRNRRPSSPAAAWKEDLKQTIYDGWSDWGQTNALLKAIATYGRVFEKLSGAELEHYITKVAIGSPGFTRWCRHQHEIERKARSWARSVEGYYYPLHSSDRTAEAITTNGNDRRAQDAQYRIREAVRTLAHRGLETVSQWAQNLAAAGISTRTLYKYRELWDPRVCPPTCKNDPPTGDQAPLPPPLPSVSDRPLQLLNFPDINGFLHLGGNMKCSTAETTPQKNLIREGMEGVRGSKGFSTGLEGV